MFRVWPSSHPTVRLIPVQMNAAIRRMIARTLANAADTAAGPPEPPAIVNPPKPPGTTRGAPSTKTKKAPTARR